MSLASYRCSTPRPGMSRPPVLTDDKTRWRLDNFIISHKSSFDRTAPQSRRDGSGDPSYGDPSYGQDGCRVGRRFPARNLGTGMSQIHSNMQASEHPSAMRGSPECQSETEHRGQWETGKETSPDRHLTDPPLPRFAGGRDQASDAEVRRRVQQWHPHLWQGCDFFAWMRLLVRNRFAVELPYIWIAVIITCVSFFHTIFRLLQD